MVRLMKNPIFVLACISIIFFMGTGLGFAAESVNIALILSKTGIAAKDNEPAITGATIALEEINSTLMKPLGKYIKLTVLDNNSTFIGSKIAAEKAVAMHVTGVIGPLWSSQALSTAKVLQQARIPMITPTATKPDITKVGSFIFRACSIDSFQGKVMAHFAAKDLKAQTAVVLINMNEEYSMDLADYFTRNFKEAGGMVLYTGSYPGNAVEFSSLVSQIKTFTPDVVFIPGYTRDSGFIIKQAKSLGLKSTFLGGDGWDDSMYEYAGDCIEGGYYTTLWHPDAPFPQSRHVQELYQKKFGRTNHDMRVPLTYDALMLMANAIKTARSTDPVKVRDALAATKGFDGASGTISFGEAGDPMNKEIVILTFKDKTSAFVKSVGP